jgi:hypothetical protein
MLHVVWIFGLLLGAAAFLILAPPIVQDQAYHAFADQRAVFGIPNFWNFVSNLPFCVIGILGLRIFRGSAERVLFTGVLLICFGSAYYHLAPSDARLVWDRLPMTLTFMSFLGLITGEGLGPQRRRRILASLVICGIASVVWWRATGDLRPYVLVQFGSMLALVPAACLSGRTRKLWPVLALYVLAKFAEHYDRAIYSVLPVSGHTLKHLLAALAAFWILRWRLSSEYHQNFFITSEGLQRTPSGIVRPWRKTCDTKITLLKVLVGSLIVGLSRSMPS